MKIESYRDLLVWQKAMDLVVECYKFVSELPKNETYGLISQVQRSAVSIPANIAEGQGRDHLGDYLRHLSIANGSLKELETHLLLIERLGYRPENDAAPLLIKCNEVGKMLSGLSKSLRGIK
ncbi:MAG TPA: four helix bundle protein [Blastocatellia bacterium]|nr:four helix bundle protein [Blastocatellia bacterium]